MTIKLKALSEQTVVITGGSSSIGLATARKAAEAGAAVVLAARNEAALRDVCAAIRARGGRATYAVGGKFGDTIRSKRFRSGKFARGSRYQVP